MKALLYGILLLLVLSLISCEKQLTYPSVHYLKEADIYIVINTIRDIKNDSIPANSWANGPNAKSFRFYLSNNIDSLGHDYIDVIFNEIPGRWNMHFEIPKDSLRNIYIKYEGKGYYIISSIVSDKYKIKVYHESPRPPYFWTDSTTIKNPRLYDLWMDPFHDVNAFERFSDDSTRMLEVKNLNVFWDI